MDISQIRNATVTIHAGEHVILVDPMLAPKGAIPSLKYATTKRRRNPIVELPAETSALLEGVTACLITHCQRGHFDHLDRAGAKWLRENEVPVYCSTEDAEFLRRKGLDVHELDPAKENEFFGGTIDLVPCLHGRGLVGAMMAHGFGYLIRLPNEPTLYLSGDTILSPTVRAFVEENQPDVVVIPAGGARFDVGGDIIMGLEEAFELGKLAKGRVIANHLEALDHCPVSREEMHNQVQAHDWSNRFFVPRDGETLRF